jgi:ubiquinone/menaquinone biosynthesis C-methylase UbiE
MKDSYNILNLSRKMHKMDLQKEDDYTVRRLHRIADLINDKQVLDVGCGRGLLHKIIGKNVSYFGIDFAGEFLKNDNWLGFSSAHRIVASADKLPLRDNSFQVIVCSEVLEHLPYDLPEKCLSEIFRILKKHGVLIVSTPNFAHFTNRLYFLARGHIRGMNDIRHVKFFTKTDLKKLLKLAGFKFVERHAFDIILGSDNPLSRIAHAVPYMIRRRIAVMSLFDQLIILRAFKED